MAITPSEAARVAGEGLDFAQRRYLAESQALIDNGLIELLRTKPDYRGGFGFPLVDVPGNVEIGPVGAVLVARYQAAGWAEVEYRDGPGDPMLHLRII